MIPRQALQTTPKSKWLSHCLEAERNEASKILPKKAFSMQLQKCHAFSRLAVFIIRTTMINGTLESVRKRSFKRMRRILKQMIKSDLDFCYSEASDARIFCLPAPSRHGCRQPWKQERRIVFCYFHLKWYQMRGEVQEWIFQKHVGNM